MHQWNNSSAAISETWIIQNYIDRILRMGISGITETSKPWYQIFSLKPSKEWQRNGGWTRRSGISRCSCFLYLSLPEATTQSRPREARPVILDKCASRALPTYTYTWISTIHTYFDSSTRVFPTLPYSLSGSLQDSSVGRGRVVLHRWRIKVRLGQSRVTVQSLHSCH